MSVRLFALLSVAALGSSIATLNSAPQATASRTGVSVGVGCAYVETSALGTVVVMVESSASPVPPVAPGSSCAAAYHTLMSQSYRLVSNATVSAGDYNDDGKVDAADYVIWRKTSATDPERKGTIVITKCAALGGRVDATEMSLVDSFGDVTPPLTGGVSCAAGVNALMDQGFVLLHEGPTVVADVNGDQAPDSGDYQVWRANFGAGG
jgi:hypothetical protein